MLESGVDAATAMPQHPVHRRLGGHQGQWGKSPLPTRNQTFILPSTSPQPSYCADWATQLSAMSPCGSKSKAHSWFLLICKYLRTSKVFYMILHSYEAMLGIRYIHLAQHWEGDQSIFGFHKKWGCFDLVTITLSRTLLCGVLVNITTS